MLYVTPSPVGNLEDITLRTLNLLKIAEVVICEDSRQTRKLIELLKINNKPQFIDIIKGHELNTNKILKEIESQKENQKKITLLMTDSGTPGISDPGREIINLFKSNQLPYTVLPGASSLIPAIVASGFVSKEFVFYGFLPIKKGRQKTWQEINLQKYPVALFESVHRMEKFIQETKKYLNKNQQIFIAREISKVHETYWSGTVLELELAKIKLKGEFVIIIYPFD